LIETELYGGNLFFIGNMCQAYGIYLFSSALHDNICNTIMLIDQLTSDGDVLEAMTLL